MNETICFFNTAIPWGGGEKWHFETAKHLHTNGCNVVVFCHKKSVLYKKVVLNNIPHEAISNSNRSFLNPFKLLSVKKCLEKHKVNTLVLNLSQDLKTGGFAGKLAGVQRIIYRRGSAIPIRNSMLNRFLYKNVLHEILVNSIATRDCILINNKTLFPKDHIHIIRNGIESDEFLKNNFNPYYKRKNDKLVLTNLGRLEEQKNQLFLIDVAVELRKRKIDFHMIIGGSGRLEEIIKNKISVNHLEDFVQLVGFVKNPKDLYMSGDVFLLPSLWEGFGYVIAEAGLCEKPTVAFDISSNPEVIDHNETGILVKYNDLTAFCDAIISFDKNRELITKMGTAAQKNVLDKFDEKTINTDVESYLTNKEPPKITALVTTYNEEKNIERCLNTVKWADEILVVDSFSSDKTVEICKQFGAKVIQREYDYAASQKNWAIPKATHQWIFLLDADEEVDIIIEKELREILQSRIKHSAFWLKRKNYFLKQHIRFCGWQNDRVVRFFHRDHHRYEDKRVHAEIFGSKQMGVLKTVIKHHTAQTLEAYIKKINRYAGYAAQELIKKNIKIGWVALYIKPAYKFLHNYIIRGGVLDGKNGWIICSLRAKEVWLRAKKAKQLNH